jgi:hypothetical protein
MESGKKKTEYIHQRIDPDLKEDFQEAASMDSRTMASALVVAIKDYIAKIKKKKS